MSKKTFRKTWLEVPDYCQWLREVKNDQFSAMCLYCKSVFALSNMGKQAISSHMKSKKHLRAICSKNESASLKTMFQQVLPIVETPSTSNAAEVLKDRTMQTFLTSDKVTEAEIFWCLHCVTEHSSFRSNARTVFLFKLMFPDSNIAQKMSLQRTKIAYLSIHGLAPYFSSQLSKEYMKCQYLVIGFDESLNKVSQKQQMDITIRYWNFDKNQVVSRYLTSVFLEHSCSKDLLNNFKGALSSSTIDLKKVIQISMDGPNVNLKFLKDLTEELSPDDPKFLDIGTCGLHTIHCAFKAGIKETGWKVVEFLRSLYYLFKDVPARRADFTYFTGSAKFPKKFCSVRWVENVDVSTRALEILPQIVKFVETSVKKKKNYIKSKNFIFISECVKDKLFASKIAFFQSLAAVVEPFLREFQSDSPMAPFLYSSLMSLVQTIMQKFIKPDVLQKNAPDLQKVDILEKDNLLPYKSIELSFAVKEQLKKVKEFESLDSIHFRKQCSNAYKKFTEKILERSPLNFPFTKGISCLDPSVVCKINIAMKRLSLCIQMLISRNWLTGIKGDRIYGCYKEVCSNPIVQASMLAYKKNETRLDDHWMTLLGNFEVPDLQCFIQTILILSHGNAFVERGFSINSECMLDNQSDESIVALRQIYDGVQAAGGIEKIKFSKSMLNYVRASHSRYVDCMEKKKLEASEKSKAESEKRKRANQLKELKNKKQKLLIDVQKEAALIDEEIKALMP